MRRATNTLFTTLLQYTIINKLKFIERKLILKIIKYDMEPNKFCHFQKNSNNKRESVQKECVLVAFLININNNNLVILVIHPITCQTLNNGNTHLQSSNSSRSLCSLTHEIQIFLIKLIIKNTRTYKFSSDEGQIRSPAHPIIDFARID